MLSEGIKQLREKKIIDERLYDWSQQPQAFRNLAAYPDDTKISREDAEDLQTFVYAIVEYIYDLADRYKDLKKRLEIRTNKKEPAINNFLKNPSNHTQYTLHPSQNPHTTQIYEQKKNQPKHQHWVPQFYLRQFSTPNSKNSGNPQTWIFSKDANDGDEKLTNIRNICGKRHMYSPVMPNGERSWTLDNRFDDLESLLEKIWPALAGDFVALDDESIRKGIALFTAVMHLRNPEVRKELKRIHQQLKAFYESSPLLPDGTPNIAAIEINGKLQDFDVSDWHNYRNWGDNEHDQFFAATIQSEARNIAQLLLKKRWSIVFSELDTFITTDKPVVLQHSSRETFGFGTEGAIVIFPLSPTRLLMMDDMHHEPSNQYYPLTPPTAGAFNATIWHGASRFLITGRPVDEVLAEICTCADAIPNE